MKRAYRSARGQSMVEYGIIVGLIAIMVGTVAIAYGPAMIHWYENRAVTEQQGNAAISELMYANNGISFSEITRSATVVALHQQVAINGRVMNADGSPDERRARTAPNADWWGRRWIMLPNPTYGSWERAVIGNASDAVAARQRALRFEPK